jgi:glycosyltransferase involved in cell wall biosynthesis
MIIMVPCYNCELQAVRVANAIDEFLTFFNSPELKIEKVIFIDNQSQDHTLQKLQSTFQGLKNTRLFATAQNEKNYGLGGSHKSLFSYALKKGIDFVAVVHGDNQANARELKRLIEVSLRHGGATVLGSRFSENSQLINYSKSRNIGNVYLNKLYSLLLAQKIEDLGSGLNMFNMQSFKDEVFLNFDDQFTFNMDVLIYLFSRKQNVQFCSISWKSEDETSNAFSLKVGWQSLAKIITWFFTKEKIWQNPQQQNYLFKMIYNG